MSLEELRVEQEAAAMLKREGGNAAREFLDVALGHIKELVGSPAGIRLRWVIGQHDNYERYKLEGSLDRRKWCFSGMNCGAVMIADLERSGGLSIDILSFILSSSPSDSDYELEVTGNREGESYKTRVRRGTLPLLLRGNGESQFEYRCLWSTPSDNTKVVRAILAWLAGDKIESEFFFYVPPSSVASNSSENSKFPWWLVGVGIYLLVGVGLAEWSDTPFGFEYLFMVLVGPVLAVLVLAVIIAILSAS